VNSWRALSSCVEESQIAYRLKKISGRLAGGATRKLLNVKGRLVLQRWIGVKS
jgi:hypothetical protein